MRWLKSQDCAGILTGICIVLVLFYFDMLGLENSGERASSGSARAAGGSRFKVPTAAAYERTPEDSTASQKSSKKGAPSAAAAALAAFGPPRSALETFRDSAPGYGGPRLPRKCSVGTFQRDWTYIAELMRNGSQPFALTRYGDGERNLIYGKEVSKQTQAFQMDKFWFEGGESEIGKDLAWSLTGHFGQPFFYGFASPYDDAHGLRWYLENTEQHCSYITYANLFVNANYAGTKALLQELVEKQLHRVVLVANYASVAYFLKQMKEQGRKLPKDFAYLELPDDAPHTYVGHFRQELIANATALARKAKPGTLFLVSGGPMAKPLIAHMWDASPQNQYCDFGSSMDEIFKGIITRPYMTPGNQYAQQVDPSWGCMEDGSPVLVGYD